MKKQFFSFALTLVLALGLTVPAFAARQDFSDVPKTHWAYDAIMRVSSDTPYPAMFQGITPTTFAPDGKITRAQFISVLHRSMGEYWAHQEGPVPYQDVPADAYFANAMIWAKKYGILPSWLINEKNIQPYTPLTRAEFCTILYNYDRWECGRDHAEWTDTYRNVFSDMDDATLGENAEAIRVAMLSFGYHLYVMNGTSNTTMSPNVPVTRAQAAAMLTRYLDLPSGKNELYQEDRRPDPGTEPQPDVKPEPQPETNPDLNTTLANNIESVAQLVNQERAKEGLSPLRVDTQLLDAAKIRALELPQLFDHQRPDGRSCFTVLDDIGYTSYSTLGENIAAGQQTPESVMSAWMNSPGHRANILNPDFTSIGVGCVAGNEGYPLYWVQLFAG